MAEGKTPHAVERFAMMDGMKQNILIRAINLLLKPFDVLFFSDMPNTLQIGCDSSKALVDKMMARAYAAREAHGALLPMQNPVEEFDVGLSDPLTEYANGELSGLAQYVVEPMSSFSDCR